MPKYVVEISPQDCGKVFKEYGEVVTDARYLFREPENVALVVFTGGHDVWPELYGENIGWNTYFNVERDLYEGRMFEQAQNHNIPCAGICRGAQFLCVKAGGKLVQDITGHGGANHSIITNDGRILWCNSSHHQMQLPPENAVPLAWSHRKRSSHYLNGDGDKIQPDREYEVVYYPNINSLGIQYHPEWDGSFCGCPKAAIEYAKEVVRDYLFGEKKALLAAK